MKKLFTKLLHESAWLYKKRNTFFFLVHLQNMYLSSHTMSLWTEICQWTFQWIFDVVLQKTAEMWRFSCSHVGTFDDMNIQAVSLTVYNVWDKVVLLFQSEYTSFNIDDNQ